MVCFILLATLLTQTFVHAQETRGPEREVPVRSAIVVGFVGGFVNHDDSKRPEVQFARLLQDRYPSTVHVEVFANREGKKALGWLLHQLDTDNNGVLTGAEKQQATIVIYGHSWGGSQAVALARQLDRLGIRVRLTMPDRQRSEDLAIRISHSGQRRSCD